MTHTHLYINWNNPKMYNYITILVPIIIYIQAAVILIESFLKRSHQIALINKFVEIDVVFQQKFTKERNLKKIKTKCISFTVIWALKIMLLTLAVFYFVYETEEWSSLYYLFIYLLPFSLSTLYYIQSMIFIVITKYNIEIINDCLKRINDKSEIDWSRVLSSLYFKKSRLNDNNDLNKVGEQIIALQKAFSIVWESTILINHCVRWSLPLGINNDFFVFVTNLYWLVLWSLNPTILSRLEVLINLMWTCINIFHIWFVSITCDRTVQEVNN